jgi:hypothetical protein
MLIKINMYISGGGCRGVWFWVISYDNVLPLITYKIHFTLIAKHRHKIGFLVKLGSHDKLSKLVSLVHLKRKYKLNVE